MLLLLFFSCFLLSPSFSQTNNNPNAYCDSSLAAMMCNTIPKLSNQSIAYNGPSGNASQPWVIGKNDRVVLSAGSYSMGNGMRFGVLPIPAIYLIENATLIINNTGSNEVDFGADIYLCGTARLWIFESTLRINNLFPFEYLIWASGTSEILYQGLTIATMAKSVEQNIGGVFGLHWMRGNSKLVLQKGVSGYSIRSSRFGLDNLEAGAFDNASIIADSVDLLGETYIATNGTLSISNSQYIDVFFEACPGVQMNISYLPDLCDLSRKNVSYSCLTPQQPSISFQLAPPLTSFVVNITNSKIFSWAISSFPGSIIHLSNIYEHANLFVGLNIERVCDSCTNQFTVLVGPNMYYGLEDTRSMTLDNAYVSGYHAWVGENITLNILSGSQVGDILPSANSFIIASDTIASTGMVQISSNSILVLNDCVIQESVLINQQAVLIATGTAFDSPPIIYASAFFADPFFSAGSPTLLGNSPVMTVVSLANATISNNTLIIMGSVIALTANNTPLVPFPTAIVELFDKSGSIIPVTNITSPVPTPALLASFFVSNLQQGNYTVQLYFAFGAAVFAKSSKNFTITSASSSSSSTSPSTSHIATTTSSSSTNIPTLSSSSSSTTSIPAATTSSALTLSPIFYFVLISVGIVFIKSP